MAKSSAQPSAQPSNQPLSFEQQLQAAEKSNTSAQFNLGIMYFSGQGVEQDYAKSADWLKKAA